MSANRRQSRKLKKPIGRDRIQSSFRFPYISRKVSTYDILSEEGLCLIEENADMDITRYRNGISR